VSEIIEERWRKVDEKEPSQSTSVFAHFERIFMSCSFITSTIEKLTERFLHFTFVGVGRQTLLQMHWSEEALQ